MARVKQTNSKPTQKGNRPSLSPEAQERTCIALAMNLAEQQLRDGTASSQLITEFVKRGSTEAKLKQALMSEQAEVMAAKAEVLRSQKRVEELYSQALDAMRKYNGQGDPDDYDY